MKVKPSAKRGRVTVQMDRADEKLLEQSAQPAKPPLSIRRILVPIDFSEYSYKSLDYAGAFALQSRAEIRLLHIVPLNYVDSELVAFDFAQLERETTASCRSRLEKIRQQRVDPSLQASLEVRVGRPVDEIVTVAREFDADLIIMSTHGYTGLKHAFLGSTTENVVRYAPCPVLTVRQHEHDFVSPSQESS